MTELPHQSDRPWVMPDWMEPYRRFLREPDRAEEWMRRTDVNLFNNGPAVVMQVATQEGVRVLERLHEAGLLVESALSRLNREAPR